MTAEPLRPFPSPLLLRAILRTATLLWVGAHLIFAFVLGMARLPPWPRGPLSVALVLLTLACLYFWEIRIARQRVILGNLGVSRRLVLFLAVAWGAVLEILAAGVLLSLGWVG